MKSKNIFRILHISDLHFCSGKKFDQAVVLDPFFERIQEETANGFAPDIIVITGDIAFRGAQEEYQMAKSFINRLYSCFWENPKNKIFIVPGNHDVSREKYRKSDVPYYDNMEDLNEELENEKFRIELLRGMDNYFEFIEGNFPYMKKLFNGLIPFVLRQKVCEKKMIGLVGLNSAWMCRKSPDQEEISIGEFQIKNAMEHLEKEGDIDIKVVLFHHPLSWLWPQDRKICMSYLNKTIILNGHLHDAEGCYYQYLDGNLFRFQTGGLYLGSESELPAKFQYMISDN